MIRFTVAGHPAPQGSKRAFATKAGIRLVESSRRVTAWRDLIANVSQPHAPDQPYTGPIRVHLDFRLPVPNSAPKRRRLWATKRPDIDKLVRACLDALTGIMWRDDSQIVRLTVTKDLAYEQPIGVSIAIEDLEGVDATPAVYKMLGTDAATRLELA